MEIYITGGAWITANGYGRMSEGKKVTFSPGMPVLPAAREVFNRPLQRYGRFDTYTKLGCASVALTLRDAGLEETEKTDAIGMVVSTHYEVIVTDINYYKTTLEQDGMLSSPNLFSYTLPVIVLGECAVLFHFTGPTFCVGDEGGKGINALKNAIEMILAGKTNKMIAGWIDNPPNEHNDNNKERLISGAIFIIIELKPDTVTPAHRRISYNNNVILSNGREISSLLELFN